MMNNPLISVIIPVFNTQEYIRHGVDSLLNQTYPNIQIILVDDGSKDDSAKICDTLAKEYAQIKCIHQSNQGILQARLNGVRVADGDFVGFIDSDDIIETDMFERLLRNALESEADISHCGYKMIMGDHEQLYYGTGKKMTQTRLEGIRDLLSGRFIEPTACTKLYKRSLFDTIAVPFRVDNHEDLLLNFLTFFRIEKAVYEDFTPYHYIRRETSYCKATDAHLQNKDADAVLDYMMQVCRGDSPVESLCEGKVAASWIQKYNRSIQIGQEACKAIRRDLPKTIHPYERKTKVQWAMIRYIPFIYNIIYKVLK